MSAPLFFPFAHVAERRAAGVALDDALADAAERAGLPLARLRAAAQSHPDLWAAPHAPRVCGGTACVLAGGSALAHAAPRARRVYCLGHCDRAPAVQDGRGDVHAPCSAKTLADALAGAVPEAREPSVRTLGCEPVVTRRLGRGDFARLDDAFADGAYQALRRVTATLTPESVTLALIASGERGRGGAGFPTGEKWRACARAPGARRVVIANGDEGDPGSFIDRVLMERDPHAVLEGLALCAYAIGAREAIVFVRSEYPAASTRLERAIAEAEAEHLLGAHAPSPLDVQVVRGFGSYVCGEETALIAALEGGRAEARPRPPFPTSEGLFGLPTVVNNVETLASVAWIFERGPDAYAALGTPGSRGTKAICLSAGFRAPGIVEVPFGATLRDIIERGGETPCERGVLEGVLLGGPMGSFLRPEACDLPLDVDALRSAGHELGHGGLVAVPSGADLGALALHLAAFMADESCGRCTPCRAGSRRARALLERGERSAESGELAQTFAAMESASLCAFGRATPRPVQGVLRALAEKRS